MLYNANEKDMDTSLKTFHILFIYITYNLIMDLITKILVNA